MAIVLNKVSGSDPLLGVAMQINRSDAYQTLDVLREEQIRAIDITRLQLQWIVCVREEVE